MPPAAPMAPSPARIAAPAIRVARCDAAAPGADAARGRAAWLMHSPPAPARTAAPRSRGRRRGRQPRCVGVPREARHARARARDRRPRPGRARRLRLLRQRLTEWVEDLRSVGGPTQLADAVEHQVQRLSAALGGGANVAAEALAVASELASSPSGAPPPAKRGRAGVLEVALCHASRATTKACVGSSSRSCSPVVRSRRPSATTFVCRTRAPVAVARDAASIATTADAARRCTERRALAIVDAPMKWNAERERLTLDYRRATATPNATDLAIEPRVIVLHYTGGGSAKATRDYFDNVKIEAARKELARGGAVNVSAHFLVDRDGTIYRLQPETRFARHCIGLNHIAIGIENVGDERQVPAHRRAGRRERRARARARGAVSDHAPARPSRGDEVSRARVLRRARPGYKNDKPDPGARVHGARARARRRPRARRASNGGR